MDCTEVGLARSYQWTIHFSDWMKPISDSRIGSSDNQEVTFLAREGTESRGSRSQIVVPLPTVEFTRRWALHIFPKGYTETFRFGGWSNSLRADYLECCRTELTAIDALVDPQAEDEAS